MESTYTPDPEFARYCSKRNEVEAAIERMLLEEKYQEQIKELLLRMSDRSSKRYCIIRDLPGVNSALLVFTDALNIMQVPIMLSNDDETIKRLQTYTLHCCRRNGHTESVVASGRDPETGIRRDSVSLPHILFDIDSTVVPPMYHHTFCPQENRPFVWGMEALIAVDASQHKKVPPLLKSRYEYLVYFRRENMLTIKQLENLLANLQFMMDDMAADDSFRECMAIRTPKLNLLDQRLDESSQWKRFITECTGKL